MTRTFFATIATATLIGGAPMAEQVLAGAHQSIGQAISDIAAGSDRHDWTRVRDAFAGQCCRSSEKSEWLLQIQVVRYLTRSATSATSRRWSPTV